MSKAEIKGLEAAVSKAEEKLGKCHTAVQLELEELDALRRMKAEQIETATARRLNPQADDGSELPAPEMPGLDSEVHRREQIVKNLHKTWAAARLAVFDARAAILSEKLAIESAARTKVGRKIANLVEELRTAEKFADASQAQITTVQEHLIRLRLDSGKQLLELTGSLDEIERALADPMIVIDRLGAKRWLDRWRSTTVEDNPSPGPITTEESDKPVRVRLPRGTIRRVAFYFWADSGALAREPLVLDVAGATAKNPMGISQPLERDFEQKLIAAKRRGETYPPPAMDTEYL